MIKKIFKFLGFLVLILIAIGAAVFFVMDESMPEGKPGVEAEQLADEMLRTLNKQAFDSLEYIEFTYVGVHSYEWDVKNNQVTVAWDDQRVFLDLNQSIDGYSLLQYKAYEYFINDTFWLIAPFKVRDAGVQRSIVDLDQNRGLLVTYTSGGVTPGDSYLWIIDEKGYPVAWKLWTSNVPIGGLEFTWAGWKKLNNVWFSTLHESTILDLAVTNLKVR